VFVDITLWKRQRDANIIGVLVGTLGVGMYTANEITENYYAVLGRGTLDSIMIWLCNVY
jgi:hypothetical protein